MGFVAGDLAHSRLARGFSGHVHSGEAQPVLAGSVDEPNPFLTRRHSARGPPWGATPLQVQEPRTRLDACVSPSLHGPPPTPCLTALPPHALLVAGVLQSVRSTGTLMLSQPALGHCLSEQVLSQPLGTLTTWEVDAGLKPSAPRPSSHGGVVAATARARGPGFSSSTLCPCSPGS